MFYFIYVLFFKNKKSDQFFKGNYVPRRLWRRVVEQIFAQRANTRGTTAGCSSEGALPLDPSFKQMSLKMVSSFFLMKIIKKPRVLF
jgi:hypothetical protein